MNTIVNPNTQSVYHIEGSLGRGAFGQVYKAYNPGMGRTVALKMINCSSAKESQDAVTEAMYHGTINHENIVRCYAVFSIFNHLGGVVVCLVEEFCEGGSLAHLIEERQTINSSTIKNWVIQLLRGVMKIHELNIIHRDIKPHNIFLKKNVIKVGDLGVAVTRYKINSLDVRLHRTQNGDLISMAPEMFANKSYDMPVDVFGVGIVLLSLIVKCSKPTYNGTPIGLILNHGTSLQKVLASFDISKEHKFYPALMSMLKLRRSERLSSSEAYDLLSSI